MGYIHPDVLDDGWNEVTNNATHLHIINTVADPADRAEVLTDTVGNRAVGGAWVIPAPSDRPAGGREIVIPEITDGTVTAAAADTARRWAIIDGTRLLASDELREPRTVTPGNVFTLAQMRIGKKNP